MRARSTVLALVLAVFLSPGMTLAFETDQYDLPPQPLKDIGDEVAAHVELKLRIAIDKINAAISAADNCIAAGAAHRLHGCGDPVIERSKLEYLRSEDAIAQKVFEQLGGGIPPFTKM